MIGRLGFPELLIILAVVVLIWGPKRLPEMGKGLGEAIRGFKSSIRDGEEKK